MDCPFDQVRWPLLYRIVPFLFCFLVLYTNGLYFWPNEVTVTLSYCTVLVVVVVLYTNGLYFWPSEVTVTVSYCVQMDCTFDQRKWPLQYRIVCKWTVLLTKGSDRYSIVLCTNGLYFWPSEVSVAVSYCVQMGCTFDQVRGPLQYRIVYKWAVLLTKCGDCIKWCVVYDTVLCLSEVTTTLPLYLTQRYRSCSPPLYRNAYRWTVFCPSEAIVTLPYCVQVYDTVLCPGKVTITLVVLCTSIRHCVLPR